ncbi:baeRF3 domain-containing protein [Nocardioides szechwanensis]|uniref:baeRF3 domain-containing protein n=1 Tax=Nocardioides szechwanensis TaxID=1005944 RepID=UPI000B88C4C8|nr:hypothetical protein [Nocardioides szechwanensis]
MAQVDRELSEHGVTNRAPLLRKLAEQVSRVAVGPTDQGLVIYVSLAVTRSFRLPQPVPARAVVEKTFATRPLISALYRMPPHVLLMLRPTCAHLYAGADGGLRPAGQLDPFKGKSPIRMPPAGSSGATDVRDELAESYLRGVDRMLGDYRSKHPSALVLAGPPRLLDRFCALSRDLERLAGRLDANQYTTALDLALASTNAIQDSLRTRRADALGQLHQAMRDRPGDVATGIDGCWRTMGARKPAMLLVEESFISPGTHRRASVSEGASESTNRQADRCVHDLVAVGPSQYVKGAAVSVVGGVRRR